MISLANALVRRTLVLVVLPLLLSACTDTVFGPSPSQLSTSTQRVAQLTEALRERPEDARVLRDLGQEYALLGNWNASLGAYREALIIDAGDRDAIVGFARAQLATGDFAGALVQADAALAMRADVPALVVKGGALVGLNRLDDARTVLQAAVAAQPRDLDVRTNLALAEAMARRPEAYGLARTVAFAPDADVRHKRNLVLVGGLLQMDAAARRDAALLGIPETDVREILAIGARGRTQGLPAFGMAPLQAG